MNDQEENLWEIHKLSCEWVRFADSKASIILATQGLIATVAIPQVMPLAEPLVRNWQVITLIILAVLSAGWSGLSAILAIVPRLKGRTKDAAAIPTSCIFFEHIAKNHKNASLFATSVSPIVSDTRLIQKELSHQIWANSLVATRKFKYTRSAVVSLAASLALGMAATILYFCQQAFKA